MFFNNSFYISSHGAEYLNIFPFLFLQTFLLINSISLCFDPWIFCHPLTNLFLSFLLFLVLLWMLSYATRITNNDFRNNFKEKLFSVSKEWVRSWSHPSLIIYHKTFAKKLKTVRPKSCREGEKEKERQLQSVIR